MPLDVFHIFANQLAAHGLNLVDAVPIEVAAASYRADPACPLPAARTVLVCGSGGRSHWESLTAADHTRAQPIAAAAQRVIEASLSLLGGDARLVTPAEIARFDLRSLAHLAGWGTVSPYLLMLIHPVFGPWVSVRTLVLTHAVIAGSGAPTDYDPCGPCTRPCLDACPAGAYSRVEEWDFPKCAEHRLCGRAPSRHCDDGCHSRIACVVGREHAYGHDEYRHRHQANVADLRHHLDEFRK